MSRAPRRPRFVYPGDNGDEGSRASTASTSSCRSTPQKKTYQWWDGDLFAATDMKYEERGEASTG